MAASISTCNTTLVYSASYKNAFHSYCSFLAYLYNLSHRLTELNISLFLFLFHKTVFLQQYLMKTQPHVNVKAIKLNFIQQVYLQSFLVKQGNF